MLLQGLGAPPITDASGDQWTFYQDQGEGHGNMWADMYGTLSANNGQFDPTPIPAFVSYHWKTYQGGGEDGSLVSTVAVVDAIDGFPIGMFYTSPQGYYFRTFNPRTKQIEDSYIWNVPNGDAGMARLFLPKSVALRIAAQQGNVQLAYAPPEQTDYTGYLAMALIGGFAFAVAAGAAAATAGAAGAGSAGVDTAALNIAAAQTNAEIASTIASSGGAPIGATIIDTGGALSDATQIQAFTGQFTEGLTLPPAASTVAPGATIIDSGGAGFGSDATFVQATTGQFTEAAGAYTTEASLSTVKTVFDAAKQAGSILNQVKTGAGAIAAVMSGGAVTGSKSGPAPAPGYGAKTPGVPSTGWPPYDGRDPGPVIEGPGFNVGSVPVSQNALLVGAGLLAVLFVLKGK